MIIKEIDEKTYTDFVETSSLKTFYQSVEWKSFKELEDKKCELVGLFKNELLVGVSLLIYSKVLKGYHMAYASRGFIYDYSDILGFKNALIKYLSKKKVIFFRMDSPIILATYNPKMEKSMIQSSSDLIEELKRNGFIHFGYNTGYETLQFRFIHRLNVKSSFDEQLSEMNKSTKKNIESSEFRGVRIKVVSADRLDDVLHFFELTTSRKEFSGLSKNFYMRLLETFKSDVKLYITYIDKNIYLDNLKEKIANLNRELVDLQEKKKHDNIGKKIKNQESIINSMIQKYNEEIIMAKSLEEQTEIASLVTISKYNEIVAFASGMDNNYRKFNPKYAFYPAMIKDAISMKKEYVNFLGVKNILNKDDKDYGIYEVKRGFGGETVEFIGEFDLPIRPNLYKFYKWVNKK